jgi:hypothetical protein
MKWAKRITVSIPVVWQVLLLAFLTLAGVEDRIAGAMAGMLWGLCLIWIGGCGLISIFGCDVVRRIIHRVPLPPSVMFFLFVTVLALIEEAIATLMTNCAPLLGVRVGEVYLTVAVSDGGTIRSQSSFPSWRRCLWSRSCYS